MKILASINTAVFLTLLYTTSFTKESAEIVYTNEIAEFIADPLLFAWMCTYGVILGIIFIND